MRRKNNVKCLVAIMVLLLSVTAQAENNNVVPVGNLGDVQSQSMFGAVSSGNSLQFSWVDNQGDTGSFIWDPSQGFTSAAISEFSYILYDGTLTPPGFLPNTFTTFNSGFSWDLNTGIEGVDFTFATAFTSPLSMTSSDYDMAFVSGNFMTQNDVRKWNDITVMVVPTPTSGLLIFVMGCMLLFHRQRL